MKKLTVKFPKNVALVVVDAQNDFMPGGNLAVTEGNEIVPVINNIRDAFNLVVFTKDWHPKNHKSFAVNNNAEAFTTKEFPYGVQVMWPEHCAQGTKGAELHEDLDVRDEDLVLLKGTNPEVDSYSALKENDGKAQPKFDNGNTFEDEMKERGIDTLVFTGLAGDYCVAWNIEDALAAKFKVVAVNEAIKSIDNNAYKAKQEELKDKVTFTNAADLPKLFAA